MSLANCISFNLYTLEYVGSGVCSILVDKQKDEPYSLKSCSMTERANESGTDKRERENLL